MTITHRTETPVSGGVSEGDGALRLEQKPVREPIPEIEQTFSLLARRSTLPRVHAFFSAQAGTQLDWYAYMALYWIANAGPIRLSALAEHFGVVPSTVCRHVQQLDRAGLIDRQPDEADRRAVLLTPSPQGAQVLRELQEARRAALAEALNQWSDSDLDDLNHLLGRLDVDLGEWGRRLRDFGNSST